MRGFAIGGGGANGAFSTASINELYRYGYKPDVIAGTSQGALAGMMLAQGMQEELDLLWRMVNPDMITGRPYNITPITVANAILKQSKGVLSNEPLRNLVKKYASLDKLIMPLYVSVYDYYTEQHHSILCNDLETDEEYVDIIMASTAMPVVWGAVYYKGMCLYDGGLERTIPVLNLLPHKDELDEIIAISCNPLSKEKDGSSDDNLLKIGIKLLSVFLFGITKDNIKDLNEFNCKKLIIAPDKKIGSNIDFNNKTVMDRYIIGQKTSRKLIDEYEQFNTTI